MPENIVFNSLSQKSRSFLERKWNKLSSNNPFKDESRPRRKISNNYHKDYSKSMMLKTNLISPDSSMTSGTILDV